MLCTGAGYSQEGWGSVRFLSPMALGSSVTPGSTILDSLAGVLPGVAVP